MKVLEAAEPAGATRVGDVLSWIGGRLRRRGIVVIFSDFFDDLNRIVEGMRRLKHGGHEPILFQVLDPQELEFDYERLRRLDGLEGAGRIKVDPKAIRASTVHALALGLHVEVVTNLTPGINDDHDELRQLAGWIAEAPSA